MRETPDTLGRSGRNARTILFLNGPFHYADVSLELIGILSVGAAIAGLILTCQRGMDRRLTALDQRLTEQISELAQRIARLESRLAGMSLLTADPAS